MAGAQFFNLSRSSLVKPSRPLLYNPIKVYCFSFIFLLSVPVLHFKRLLISVFQEQILCFVTLNLVSDLVGMWEGRVNVQTFSSLDPVLLNCMIHLLRLKSGSSYENAWEIKEGLIFGLLGVKMRSLVKWVC